MYRTLFYVNMYGSYKLSKNSAVFFGPPCMKQCFMTGVVIQCYRNDPNHPNGANSYNATMTAQLAYYTVCLLLGQFTYCISRSLYTYTVIKCTARIA